MDIWSPLHCYKIFTQMPCAKKASTQAKLQCGGPHLAQQNSTLQNLTICLSMTHLTMTLSEDEEGGTLDSITAMQQLYCYLTFCAQDITMCPTANLQPQKFWCCSAWTCVTQ